MTDRVPNADSRDAFQAVRARIAELEGEARALTEADARHDVANALGAARNALILLDEGEQDEVEAKRFADVARRNVDRAEAMLRSARNARNDLGRQGERDHGNTLGF